MVNKQCNSYVTDNKPALCHVGCYQWSADLCYLPDILSGRVCFSQENILIVMTACLLPQSYVSETLYTEWSHVHEDKVLQLNSLVLDNSQKSSSYHSFNGKWKKAWPKNAENKENDTTAEKNKVHQKTLKTISKLPNREHTFCSKQHKMDRLLQLTNLAL